MHETQMKIHIQILRRKDCILILQYQKGFWLDYQRALEMTSPKIASSKYLSSVCSSSRDFPMDSPDLWF